MIHIAMIEDDVDFRDALQSYLQAQPDFVCELVADSVEEFLSLLPQATEPDVVLMDIGLPGMSGIRGMALLKERYPDMDIIMLTIYHDSPKIFEALRAGASGYLLKNTPLSEIKEAIALLYGGGAPMSPQIARKVIAYFSRSKAPATLSPLTRREREIVNGLVDGLSYKMIADRLSISIETVRYHIKNIYEKLHVHSKAEVITKSLRGEI